MSEELRIRASRVTLLVLDSDGVLTDGGVYIGDDGREFRRFDIRDGMGLKRLIEHEIAVAVISSSPSAAVRYRCATLGIQEVHFGVKDKLLELISLSGRLKSPLEHVAYMGDDLVDIPVMEKVGLPCAPADAVGQVLDLAVCVTENSGGHGAVRELCDFLISVR